MDCEAVRTRLADALGPRYDVMVEEASRVFGPVQVIIGIRLVVEPENCRLALPVAAAILEGGSAMPIKMLGQFVREKHARHWDRQVRNRVRRLWRDGRDTAMVVG